MLKGLIRRWFRWYVVRAAAQSHLPAGRGAQILWGYGLRIAYPDRGIWVHQFVDIFAHDVYGLAGLPRGSRVLDVGANIGMFALAARWRHPSAAITCIEPHPGNFEVLLRNLAANGSRDMATIQAAVGSNGKTTTIGGGASDAIRVGVGGGVQVPTVRLDSVIESKVDLLKLDVEGAELDVLRSAGSRLHDVERVAMEVHDYQNAAADWSDLVGLLNHAGFDRFSIGEHRTFRPRDAWSPVHCCMLTAWRSAGALGLGVSGGR